MSENGQTIQELLAQLEEARKNLDAAEQEAQKASHRETDARNVFNGITKRLDEAMRKLRADAPRDTNWSRGQQKGVTA